MFAPLSPPTVEMPGVLMQTPPSLSPNKMISSKDGSEKTSPMGWKIDMKIDAHQNIKDRSRVQGRALLALGLLLIPLAIFSALAPEHNRRFAMLIGVLAQAIHLICELQSASLTPETRKRATIMFQFVSTIVSLVLFQAGARGTSFAFTLCWIHTAGASEKHREVLYSSLFCGVVTIVVEIFVACLTKSDRVRSRTSVAVEAASVALMFVWCVVYRWYTVRGTAVIKQSASTNTAPQINLNSPGSVEVTLPRRGSLRRVKSGSMSPLTQALCTTPKGNPLSVVSFRHDSFATRDNFSFRTPRSPNPDPNLAAPGSPEDTTSPPLQRWGSLRKSVLVTNRWKKGQLVGRGASGDVYIALLSDSGQLAVVKTVEFDASDPQLKDKLSLLANEITILKELDHPHIVRYYFCERSGSKMHILMEYVPGGSIHAVLSHFGALSEQVVASYTHQVLLALAHLHERGIIHRDIKCANLLLNTAGDVKIADFGASSKQSTVQSPNHAVATSMVGTPAWMAPEVIRGEPQTAQLDIWSLGCTVMEMLTARPPWHHVCDTPMKIINYIASLEQDPSLPQNISAWASDFIGQCLKLDPRQRPTASALLAHPFFDCLQ